MARGSILYNNILWPSSATHLPVSRTKHNNYILGNMAGNQQELTIMPEHLTVITIISLLLFSSTVSVLHVTSNKSKSKSLWLN